VTAFFFAGHKNNFLRDFVLCFVFYCFRRFEITLPPFSFGLFYGRIKGLFSTDTETSDVKVTLT
jgi:hypothetical protein